MGVSVSMCVCVGGGVGVCVWDDKKIKRRDKKESIRVTPSLLEIMPKKITERRRTIRYI